MFKMGKVFVTILCLVLIGTQNISCLYEGELNIFSIPPNDKLEVLKQNSGIAPSSHEHYEVINIGRTEVLAKIKYGTTINWLGDVESSTVLPGETKVLNNGGKPYYVTALKIYNRSNNRAIIVAHTVPNDVVHQKQKTEVPVDELSEFVGGPIVRSSEVYIPKQGDRFGDVSQHFWPDNENSTFECVREKLEKLLDSKILQTVNGILEGDVKQIQEKIRHVESEINFKTSKAAYHYMNLAKDLVGLENKFVFDTALADNRRINLHLLPFYTLTVSLKMAFYTFGMTNGKKIGLNPNELSLYGERLLKDHVNNYIKNMYIERVNNAYEIMDPRMIFNGIMNVRTFIALNGLEFLSIWNQMVEKPHLTKPPYIETISYSQLYGRETGLITREAISPEMTQPLTPNLINQRRNRLRGVEVHIWRINEGTKEAGPPKVGGLRLVYENNDEYQLGRSSNETEKIEFNNGKLIKLTAWGNGAIDGLTFHFDMGKEVFVGTMEEHGEHSAFQMEGHHIVSMMLANDLPSTGGQAVNIAVAYQPIN
ncbi:unnamed protein product [Brassicogethes aeneus]|uniref:Pesticidal crystal protein domain-containing protein n=1 Tax=Brassicogethes aeneus TaxID=1431903 RepID=A0A9P0FJB8_BRAAE|nr:unnamed protein product [Brassicogethes aeneus]